MPEKRHNKEQILRALRRAEAGAKVSDIVANSESATRPFMLEWLDEFANRAGCQSR